MLPRETSPTRSSKSSTSKTRSRGLQTPVQYVKGVGPKLAQVFRARGIYSVGDLIQFFPRTYEDRLSKTPVGDLEDGRAATVEVRVLSARKIPLRNRRQRILEVRAEDETGPIAFKWFHAPHGMEKSFQAGQKIMAFGTPKTFMGRSEMTHPEIIRSRNADRDSGRIVPIYVEIEGIPSRILRKVLWNALESYGASITEDIPVELLKRHGLSKLDQCIRDLHFPDSNDKEYIQLLNDFSTPAHSRMIYDEFFKFELLVLRKKIRRELDRARSMGPSRIQFDIEGLPFSLTGDQSKTIDTIIKDIAKDQPMNRLLQGDVGCGKTLVAFLAGIQTIRAGYQVALMAPTEILAEQHFLNFKKFFQKTEIPFRLLTGSTASSDRKEILELIASGSPSLLVGTHALIEAPVVFKRLGLVVIDEQHRFGVDQKRKLREKGLFELDGKKKGYPHTLVMSATPIPRTLALTAYGDLSVSQIKEMPPGRSEIKTRMVAPNLRHQAFELVRREIRKGRQAYFVYPLVNESEAEGFASLKAAVKEVEILREKVFPEFKIGLLHGKLKPEEKNQIMEDFKSGAIHILASTTVVEVGVDVPNSTVMVIEHAERFGLSQLHQLRGRVGRGEFQSYCLLMVSKPPGEVSKLRLDTLEKTNDGFKVAEVDLEIRGPGEFLGTRQSGDLPFKMADLVRDQDWLLKARQDAENVLHSDPELKKPENIRLLRFSEGDGRLQTERFQTS